MRGAWTQSLHAPSQISRANIVLTATLSSPNELLPKRHSTTQNSPELQSGQSLFTSYILVLN